MLLQLFSYGWLFKLLLGVHGKFPNFSFGIVPANMCLSVWITSSEVATLQLREKTLSLATFCGFVWQIIIIYVNPYLENAGYGNLQGEVGFVYGGLSFLSILFVIFYLPELKNRSLEELDELFQKRVSVFKFGSYKTDGIGSWITTVEHKGTGAEVLDGKEVGHIGTVEVEAENDISEKKADV